MEMNEKLKLQAYYYGFSETGVRSIDLVLRAVSAAGKLFHHTDQWTSEINYPVENVRGPAPVDWIQNAADDAADAYKKLQSTLATTQAALEAKEKECELAAKYVEQEYNGASLPDSPVLALLEIARERGKQFERVISERDTALAEAERDEQLNRLRIPCKDCHGSGFSSFGDVCGNCSGGYTGYATPEMLAERDAKVAELEYTRDLITELRENGFWKSCSGCHETIDGQETGDYPYSKIFQCYIGSGCDECGGLGVIWERCNEEELKKWHENYVTQEQRITTLEAALAAKTAECERLEQ